MSGANDTAFCAVCERDRGTAMRVPLDGILEHLAVCHGIDATPSEWPDGGVVIIDQTLEPADFDEDAA